MPSDYETRKEYYKKRYKKQRENPEWIEEQKIKCNNYKKVYKQSGKAETAISSYRKSYEGRRCIKVSEWKTKKGWRETPERFKYIFHKWYHAKNCDLCNIKLTAKNKCADHEHNSGTFRCVCCTKCNAEIAVIDRKRMLVCLEIHRYFKV